jgi:hypothetical protein
MALDKTALANALIAIETQIVEESLAPLALDDTTREKIERKCNLTADAIYTWILTATVNVSVNTTTLHPTGVIAVAGSAVAQTNPLPVAGTGTGSGTGTIS